MMMMMVGSWRRCDCGL